MSLMVASGNVDDIKDERVPECLQWTCEDVADWAEKLGYPMYRDCFLSNKITGRRLILMEASALPAIGINDFIHIRHIAENIRKRLTIEDPYWNRSISQAPRETLGMFLESKCITGERADALSYETFLREHGEAMWQPPLANMCLILPD